MDPQHHRGVGEQIVGSPHSEDLRQKMRSVRGRVPDFSEMRGGCVERMEGTQRRNEGVLHCWPGQLNRVGSDDSGRLDQHRRCYWLEI